MRKIRVGKPLAPGVRDYEEGIHYNYTIGGHTLIMVKKEPSRVLIESVQGGQTAFALLSREDVIFVLVKFGRLPWEIAHYNWWINAPAMRPDPWSDLERHNGGLVAHVCLVNASNGLVAALRLVTLPAEFTHVFLQMVQSQMAPPFDPWRYLEVVERTFQQVPNRSDLLKEAVCFCMEDTPSPSSIQMASLHTSH